MNMTQHVKELLDKDKEVCIHTSGIKDLRKIIAFLKSIGNIIYAENCECGLTERKHRAYVKDWAI